MSMVRDHRVNYTGVLWALFLQSLVTIGFFVIGAWRNDSTQYWYFLWNLVLAWLPLIFAFNLAKFLKKNRWVSWQGILLTVLWLGFLPNSFYMVSDFIHLGNVIRADPVFDVAMFASFAISGLVLGFTSLYLVHRELVKRLKPTRAHWLIAGVLLLSSFAIYLGRDLRWNTWDILINPAGIIFDVTDPIINPGTHPETFSTTFGFFGLLGSVYIVIWQFIKSIQLNQQN
jgi:uncharacterized membrane protein